MGFATVSGGSRATAPSAGILASDIAVGSIVKLMESGSAVEYLVVNQGIPSGSSLYDESCSGCWLLRKDIHSDMTWWQTGGVIYSGSDINTWLNGEFFNTLGSAEQSVIKQVKIPYVKNYSSGAIASGADGLSTKAFILSLREVGWPSSTVNKVPDDGEKLDYFEEGTGMSANNKRIANLNGSAHDYWTRSTYIYTTGVWRITELGDKASCSPDYNYGARPALILPSNAKFDADTMLLKGVA